MSNKPDLLSDNGGNLFKAVGVAVMAYGTLNGKMFGVVVGGFLMVFGALLRIDDAIRRQKSE
ncbi:hypothetical protein ACFQY4_46045 [Catellatospora bangladeshensis]|uniref:Uncharacterized protein n=1 Tax=Catellatospora bangladeshensis TaxID=310355 RepID=A0A8J3NN03_9ACTN|nr:hypothetical protein [Catellatospora bangladeshensis]GIF86485.1 hypothetical protein Cba03nite_78340 [Catellatospora bangladeshensis]